MTDDVDTISGTLVDRMTDICDNKDISLQEKLTLFTNFKDTYDEDITKLIDMDDYVANEILEAIDGYISVFQRKIATEKIIKQKNEIDIPAEYDGLNLDKTQLKNKQYINEIVPRLLGSNHRVGYIMLCIYSKLKTGVSDHIKNIIEQLKTNQTLDFSYPPFYLDYPANNVNVNSLNDLFVYTHIGLYYYEKLYPGEQNIQIFNNVLNRVLTHDIVDYSDKSFVTDNLGALQFSNDDDNKLKFQQIFTNICCCILSPGIKNNIAIHSELRSLVTLMIYYIGLNYNAIKSKLKKDWEKLYLYYLCQQDGINAFIDSNFANVPKTYENYKPDNALQLSLLSGPLQNDINNDDIKKIFNNSPYVYQPFDCKNKGKKIADISIDLIPDADRAEVGKYLTADMIDLYFDAEGYQPNKNNSDKFATILNSNTPIINLITMLNSDDFRFKDYRRYLIAYIELYRKYHQKDKNYKKMSKLNLKNNVAMNISANGLRTKNVSTELNKLNINDQCSKIGDDIVPIETEVETKVGTEVEKNKFKTYKFNGSEQFLQEMQSDLNTLLDYSTMLSILFKIPYLLPEYLGKLYSKTKFSKATINRIVDYISKINKHDNKGEIVCDNKDLPETFETKRNFFERVLEHYDIEFAFKNAFANDNVDRVEYSMHSRFEIFDQIINSKKPLLCIDDFNYISEYIFKATFCNGLSNDCSSYAIAASKKILSQYVNDGKIGDISGEGPTKNVTQTDLNEVNNYIQTVYKPKFVNIRGSTEVDDTEITPTLAQDIIEETNTVTYVLFYVNDQHKQFETKFEDYKFITELETMKLFNDIVKPDKLYKGLAKTIQNRDQFDQTYTPSNDNKKAILKDFIDYSGLDLNTAKISAAGNFKFSLLKLLFIIFIVLIVIIVIIKFAPKIKNFIKKHL